MCSKSISYLLIMACFFLLVGCEKKVVIEVPGSDCNIKTLKGCTKNQIRAMQMAGDSSKESTVQIDVDALIKESKNKK